MIKKNKKNKIFLLSIVKIKKNKYKLVFIHNFDLINDNYKGYFIDKLIIEKPFLFENIQSKDFYKWYKVEFDFYGNLLYLYYKKRTINLQETSK